MPDDEVMRGLLAGGICAAVTACLVWSLVRKAPALKGWLPACILLRLLGFFFHVFWALPYYANSGSDALGYHNRAMLIAESISDGRWTDVPWGIGTSAVDCFTGLFYALFGPNLYAMFFLSACVSVVTSLIFARAALLLEDASQLRVYLALLFVAPSFVMWSSVFGKDSFVLLGLALFTYGYARSVETSRAGGGATTLTGLLVVTAIRPHIAALIVASMIVAHSLGRQAGRGHRLILKVFKLAVLVTAFGVLLPLLQHYIALDTLGMQDILQRNNTTAQANSVGGSALQYSTINSPVEMIAAVPAGAVNLFLRPFPWEASNVNAELASIENVGLLILIVVSRSRIVRACRKLFREPVLLLSLVIVAALIVFFSTTTNLGLLSRLRVQMLPYLFLLIGMSHTRHRGIGAVSAPPPVAAWSSCAVRG